MSRGMSGAHTFLRIHTEMTPKEELNEEQLHGIIDRIGSIDSENYVEALQHQIGTGGCDEDLQELINQEKENFNSTRVKAA